jgi:hypothetical protein
MHDRLPGIRADHLRHEMTMAGLRILLEAQQTHAPLARQHLRLCQFDLRAIRAHVFAEDGFIRSG